MSEAIPCLRDRSFVVRTIRDFLEPQKEGGARKIYGNVWITRYVQGMWDADRTILRAAVAHALAPSESDSAYRLRHVFGLPWDCIPASVGSLPEMAVFGGVPVVAVPTEYAGVWRWVAG
jgi:hypothetical protein